MSAVQYDRDARVGARRRPVRWIVAAVGAALLLGGCGTVPGAAAVVDGTRISEQTVQSRTQALIDQNSNPTQPVDPVTRALFNRYQATDVVRHQLVLAAAKAQHITVSDEQVNAFIAQNGGASQISGTLNVPADAVPEAIYDYLVLQQLVNKIPAGGVDVTDITVTVDVVPAADRDAAIAARTRYLKDPAAMAADAATARASGQVPGGQESLLADAQDALVGIFTAPQGQIVLFPQGTSGYFVIRVTQRSEKPAKLTKAAIQSASSLDGFMVLSSLLLDRYAGDVTVNPRFGQWDPQTLLVVAPNSGL